MTVIIRDKELIDKIDKLKNLFNYKTRTKYIESLVNFKYIKYEEAIKLMESEKLIDS
jgi:hypothetical protein